MELKVLATLTFWGYFQLGYVGEIALREIARNCAHFIAINCVQFIAINCAQYIAINSAQYFFTIVRNLLRKIACNRGGIARNTHCALCAQTCEIARNRHCCSQTGANCAQQNMGCAAYSTSEVASFEGNPVYEVFVKD